MPPSMLQLNVSPASFFYLTISPLPLQLLMATNVGLENALNHGLWYNTRSCDFAGEKDTVPE